MNGRGGGRIAAAMALIAAATLAACSTPLAWRPSSASAPLSSAIGASAIAAAGPAAGVYEQGVPGSWAKLTEFTAATGVQPRIVVYYSGWNESFRSAFGQRAWQHHAYLLVQLDPSGVSLASIATGRSDEYLRTYARAVRAFGHPVILSFAHEMNGNWYSWGVGHQSPTDFVAAWRHVVQVFRTTGASNVTWLWTVNSTNLAASPRRWWPGAAWVDWVGIDGYYYRPTDTFRSVFGRTLALIRKFSAAPVLVSEAAVGETADRDAQIKSLLAGVRADRLIGLIWFDQSQHNGIYHQDWRLEDHPSALSAYIAGMKLW